MKLWLDDIRPMPEGFDVHCKTYEEAETQLLTGKVTAISFDHDLGFGKTGYDLAKFIARGAYYGTIPFLGWSIHSQNPVGAKNIRSAMEKADEYWPQNIEIEDEI